MIVLDTHTWVWWVSSPDCLRFHHLPGEVHEDPADRIIIATALTLGAPLVSKDTKIRDYPHVETIW